LRRIVPKTSVHDVALVFQEVLSSNVATNLTHRRIGGLLLRVRHVETLRGVADPVKCPAHHDFSHDGDTALWFADMWETLEILFAMLMAMRIVVAGVLPAQSAARIPPSEALRR
jgi:hypothetical protein